MQGSTGTSTCAKQHAEQHGSHFARNLSTRMTSLIQQSKVDWDLVDEELDKVPEEFKDPRFDSLRHVLDILSAVDAEAALEEVNSCFPSYCTSHSHNLKG